jgi:hypothetical protein
MMRRTIASTAGSLQVVSLQRKVAIDVQSRHYNMDGFERRDYAFISLSLNEVCELRDLLTDILDDTFFQHRARPDFSEVLRLWREAKPAHRLAA